MALRRIAALTRELKRDPATHAAHWKKMGKRSIELTTFNVAESHEDVVRTKATRRLEAIIDTGMR
jgi:hypothetical protein